MRLLAVSRPKRRPVRPAVGIAAAAVPGRPESVAPLLQAKLVRPPARFAGKGLRAPPTVGPQTGLGKAPAAAVGRPNSFEKDSPLRYGRKSADRRHMDRLARLEKAAGRPGRLR